MILLIRGTMQLDNIDPPLELTIPEAYPKALVMILKNDQAKSASFDFTNKYLNFLRLMGARAMITENKNMTSGLWSIILLSTLLPCTKKMSSNFSNYISWAYLLPPTFPPFMFATTTNPLFHWLPSRFEKIRNCISQCHKIVNHTFSVKFLQNCSDVEQIRNALIRWSADSRILEFNNKFSCRYGDYQICCKLELRQGHNQNVFLLEAKI